MRGNGVVVAAVGHLHQVHVEQGDGGDGGARIDVYEEGEGEAEERYFDIAQLLCVLLLSWLLLLLLVLPFTLSHSLSPLSLSLSLPLSPSTPAAAAERALIPPGARR